MNIGVIGGYKCSKKIYKLAYQLGQLIANQGWVLICGGGSGVMEAACRGAKSQQGLTVGILPGLETESGNSFLDAKIPTGLGYARNILVVRASDILIALDGQYGTLSEIAFALNEKKTVLGIDTWNIKGIIQVKAPHQAIRKIKYQILKIKKKKR